MNRKHKLPFSSFVPTISFTLKSSSDSISKHDYFRHVLSINTFVPFKIEVGQTLVWSGFLQDRIKCFTFPLVLFPIDYLRT